VAVVLAAGRGVRIRGSELVPKPLMKLGGRPLLARTLDALQAAGIERVVVVLGYMAEDVRTVLAGHTWPGMSVQTVFNPAYEKSNGLSVLAASPEAGGRFILVMSDHLLDSRIISMALESDPGDGTLLCVDRKLDRVFDMSDATKVLTQDGLIRDIGKSLAEYDAVDTGVFHCTTALSAAIRDIAARTGDCSVTAGMQALAARGLARAADIGPLLWQDVDTGEMLEEAGRRLSLIEANEDAAAHRVRQ